LLSGPSTPTAAGSGPGASTGATPGPEPRTALQALLDLQDAALLYWDVPADEVSMQGAAVEAWGLGTDTVPAATPDVGEHSMQHWIATVHPQDAPQLWDAMRKHLEGQGSAFHAVARLKQRSGGWCRLQVDGRAVARTPQGLPLEVVAVLRPTLPGTDTQQPTVETVVTSRQERLALLSALARQLRGPVRTVLGLADVLASTDGVKHEPRTTAANLQTAARALDGAIDELVDLARAEAGQLALDNTDLVLAPLVETVCDRLAASAAARDVSLQVHLPNDPIDRIHGDAARVRQVIVHLVERAIHRSAAFGTATAGPGSSPRHAEVRVRLQRHSSPRASRIDTAATHADTRAPAVREASLLVVEVQDNGRTVDAASIETMFSPWSPTRAHESTDSSPFGLALARLLVERMGGRLEVLSREGVGQIVRVWWASPRHAPDTASPGARLDAARIVIVEGGDLPSADLKSWLTQQGAYVQRCASIEGVPAAVSRLRGTDAAAGSDEAVLVIQDDQVDPSAPWGAAGEPPEGASLGEVRHLIVGRGRRTSLRRLKPEVGLIDVLRRQVFVDAVAQLMGRHVAATGTEATTTKPSASASPSSLGTDLGTGLPLPRPGVISDAAANDWLLGARVAPPTVAQARDRGQLVLLIDPEATPRAVLARQLALLGYACETVGSTVEALQAWQREPQALAIVSLQTAHDAAFEWVNDLRRHEAELGRGRMPVVGLTSAASATEAARARACGIDDVLTRPVPLLALLACLNQWMPAPRRRAGADHFVAIGTAPAQWADRGEATPGTWLWPGLQREQNLPLLGHNPSSAGQVVPFPSVVPLLPPLPPPLPSAPVAASQTSNPPTLPGRLDAIASAAATVGPAYVLDVDGLRQLVGDNDSVVRELLLDFLQLAGRHARDLREAAVGGAPVPWRGTSGRRA
jgi:signal transduction histidine kinase/CheY-like chemotaxis protein